MRHWDEREGATIERQLGLPSGAIVTVAFDAELLEPALTGAISDEQWRASIARRLASAVGEDTGREAVRRWSQLAGDIDAATFELLRAVRRRARVGLVTNATTRLAEDLRRLGIAEAFDAVVSSAVVGSCKPSPRIFRAALQAVGVAPEEAFFVDDDERHVAAARALGIDAWRYAGPASLAAELAVRGLLVPAGGASSRWPPS